jgi:dihydrofolate synthase/folylpolyglutamate synthase
VITSLSYDHTYLLGDTLASIAREKGGIIKPGIPVVSAPQPPEALEILAEIAAGRGAPLTLVGDDWLYTLEGTTWNGEQFLAGPVGGPLEMYHTALAGEHQALNAAVALAALDHARRAGVPVSPEGIRAGFEHVDWPGRLEIVNYSPLLVLDAAHNGESARRLATALDEMFPQRPRALIFGASADKDVAGMFEALLPQIDFLIAAQAVHPRALDPDTIESTARQAGFRGPVYEIPEVQGALQRAVELVGPSGLICTTGSVFIVGEMRTVCGLPVGHVLPVVQPPATAAGSSS